ncbi:MAG TPA: hypothetical protein VGL93_27745 [Streptosporangiaceae bacterium]|jgi:hypothetical protein
MAGDKPQDGADKSHRGSKEPAHGFEKPAERMNPPLDEPALPPRDPSKGTYADFISLRFEMAGPSPDDEVVYFQGLISRLFGLDPRSAVIDEDAYEARLREWRRTGFLEAVGRQTRRLRDSMRDAFVEGTAQAIMDPLWDALQPDAVGSTQPFGELIAVLRSRDFREPAVRAGVSWVATAMGAPPPFGAIAGRLAVELFRDAEADARMTGFRRRLAESMCIGDMILCLEGGGPVEDSAGLWELAESRTDAELAALLAKLLRG